MQGKELDLSIVISGKEMFQSIRRNLHCISVAKRLRLSIHELNKCRYMKTYIHVRCKQHSNSTPKHKTIRTTKEVLYWNDQ